MVKFISLMIISLFLMSFFAYIFRKTKIFKFLIVPKYTYFLLLDMQFLVLLLKNHIVNNKKLIAGFEDLQGNVLSATKVNDLFHENNVSLKLGLFMTSKDIPKELIYLTGIIHFLFDSISNLHQEDDLYKKIYDDINKIYFIVRDLTIKHQTFFFKTYHDQYHDPKTLKQLRVIKFLTI